MIFAIWFCGIIVLSIVFGEIKHQIYKNKTQFQIMLEDEFNKKLK